MRTICATLLALAIVLGGIVAQPSPSAAAVELKAGAQNVGILLFDDLFITEFVAPFDIYKHTGSKMNVFTVSPTQKAIRTYEGVTLQADYSFDNAPRIDVLVVPSGNGSTSSDLENTALINFVRRTGAAAAPAPPHSTSRRIAGGRLPLPLQACSMVARPRPFPPPL